MSAKLSTNNSALNNFLLFFPCVLLVIAVFFEYSNFDIWWVSHFYDSQNHIWPYKHHWLFDTVIHSGGRLLDRFFVLLWLISFIIANCKKTLFHYRKILLFFLCACAIGPILVGLVKSITHIYTPWNLLIFNGKYPYIRLFDAVSPNLPVGHAFPAGHASGGYCFMALYFVLHQTHPRYKYYGLLIGLLLGLIFGVGQQIRGAHFPSHDIFTLIICWYSSMLVYLLFYRKEWQSIRKTTLEQ